MIEQQRRQQALMGFKNFIFCALVIGYAFSSAFFYFTIETQTKCLFIMTYKYAALPVALLSFFLFKKLFELFFKIEKPSWPWQGSISMTILVLAFLPPYLSLLNAALPFQGNEIYVEGRIEKKWIGRGKYGSGKQLIRLNTLNCCDRKYTFMIRDEKIFQELEVGDNYERTVVTGGFGLPYKWLFW